MKIEINQSKNKKQKPDWDECGFCKFYSDNMFVTEWDDKKGWYDARIEQYAPFLIDPAALVFHYGQEVFEGMKAFYGVDGKIRLFRPEKNLHRMDETMQRLAMTNIDTDFVLEAIKKLLVIEKDWIPPVDGMAIYIRPFCIATGTHLGVKRSDTYKYFVILSPVGSYYPEGMKPTKIYVEDNYIRSAEGGIGKYKAGANYAGTLLPGDEVMKKGYSQICWLDAKEKKYVEEVGTSNIAFVINGKLVTPSLDRGTILPGVTRDTVIKLAKEWNIPVEERDITVEEVFKAAEDGSLSEVFATGTAAVISPVGLMRWKDKEVIVNEQKIGPISQRLYDEVTDLQYGKKEDKRGWIQIVE
ncbi:MAG: branched-chain amino acid aminotransferase [Eubacteriaceae bacterium]|nr:branched-chain amino acid aminotransferase [Eubacteriaceae bacterium]